MLYVLFYDYVPDMGERRAPFREAHRGLARASLEGGELVMAGAWTDPIDGAAFVFRSRQAAEAFPATDPYVLNGLVPSWRVREWNVVVGGPP
jgi:hypothetical protein